MQLSYQQESCFDLDEMLTVYRASGINRPLADRERMSVMLASANLLVTARHDGKLVGVARCLTDKAYVVYICDLLVDAALQRQGIGKTLLKKVQQLTGPGVQQLLLSAPSAMSYYPTAGFCLLPNAFAIARQV